MKRTALFLLLFLSGQALAQEPFALETGDLLFQVNGRSSYTQAIKEVTTGADGLEFSHVGVALVEADTTYVLEAVPFGVLRTPLDKFFRSSQLLDGKPVVVVGRLRPRFKGCIPQAIQTIEGLLGKRYDFLFDPADDDYYCSELVWISYRKANGKPLFKRRPMTFRDKTTGHTSPLWEAHFRRYGQPIPEGVPGTNPGDMSRERIIRIVHRYF